MAMGRRWTSKVVWVLLLVAVALVGGQVAAQGRVRIDGMDVERVASLTPGTRLNFTVFGTPGADVLLHIDGVAQPLSMREVQAGVYEGSQVLSADDQVRADARVRAMLRLRGQVSQALLAEPLLLDAPTPPAEGVAGAGRPSRPSHSAPPFPAGAPHPWPDEPPAPKQAAEAARERAPGDRSGASDEPEGALRPALPAEPRARPWPPTRPAAPGCEDCAVVESIRPLPAGTRPPISAPGLLLGGLFGERIGQAVDRHVARVTGAVDRAVHGRPLDESPGGGVEVILRLPDGQRLQRIYDRAPALQVGDRVRRSGDMGGARRERVLDAPPAPRAGSWGRLPTDRLAEAGPQP